MKFYVSIDIETLGLDPKNHDLIEVGAVFDDLKSPIEKLPRFQRYLIHPVYRGEPRAMVMNAKALERIASRDINYCFSTPSQIMDSLYRWIEEEAESRCIEYKEIIIAGKNFAKFDETFLSLLPGWDATVFHRRFLDPTCLYFNPLVDDYPPNLDACLKRAGMAKTVTHEATDDALDVIRVLRHKWGLPTGAESTSTAKEVAEALTDQFLKNGQFVGQK